MGNVPAGAAEQEGVASTDPLGVPRRLTTLGATLLLGIAALLMLVTILPAGFGWRADVVLSGSMAPRLRPGDVVVSRPATADEVAVGQIVLVDDPDRPGATLLHRMVARSADGSLTTRGDANADPDSTPVPPAAVRGLPRLTVPFVGLPAAWWQGGNLRALALTALASLLVAVAAAHGPTARTAPSASRRALPSSPGRSYAQRAVPRHSARYGRHRRSRRRDSDGTGLAADQRDPAAGGRELRKLLGRRYGVAH